jgi:hypothetical protein
LPQITADLRERLYDYMGGIIKGEHGHLFAAGGTEDHVHRPLGPESLPGRLLFFARGRSRPLKTISFARLFDMNRATSV